MYTFRLQCPLLFLFLLFLISTTICFGQNVPLKLTTFAGPPLSKPDQTGFYDLVLLEAFERAGVPIAISHLPAERSLTNANDGITDGDFVRISGLARLYPNLIQVPAKITDFEFVAFSKDASIQLKDWASAKPYHVGIVRGWKILEENLSGSASLTRVKNQKLLFTLLDKGRANIVVYSRFEGYEMIKHLGLTGVKALEPPLAVREMFLYLNKKHTRLIPVISEALKDMKQDGTYGALFDQSLAPYLQAEK